MHSDYTVVGMQRAPCSGAAVEAYMAIDLSNCLVIGISSRALFDLEAENRLFEEQGLEAYSEYQLAHENEPLAPGTGFHLIKALLDLNVRAAAGRRLIEVIVASRNSPDTGLRVFNSIREHGLDITRAAFSGGEGLSPYLGAFDVDLFLSKSGDDVQKAVDSGVPAALIYDPPHGFDPDRDQIRLAFDADAVVFSEHSEQIFREQGLDAFSEYERVNARTPLQEGPFAKLLKTLSYLQKDLNPMQAPVRIAIVTARNSPAHERVIRTLRTWGVRVDSAFFLGGVSKDRILRAFRAHIFFDDQDRHLEGASRWVPSARVPYPTGSRLAAGGNDRAPE